MRERRTGKTRGCVFWRQDRIPTYTQSTNEELSIAQNEYVPRVS